MEQSQIITRFEELLTSTGRAGMDDLLAFIRKSDFYKAPASTIYHSHHEGGLLLHSYNVYLCLKEKTNVWPWNTVLSELGDDSIIIAGLLHDICKTYLYVPEYRNQKVYSENGTKSDANGRFDWVSVPGWKHEDKIPYGHGEKSVMMIEEFIKLKPVERMMIRWHMLFTEPKEMYKTIGDAIRKYPEIIAIHEADMEATHLLEDEE